MSHAALKIAGDKPAERPTTNKAEFMKAAERSTTDKVETAKKPSVRYAEMYRRTSKSEVETLKEEKDVVDGKLARILKSSKDLENIIESQKSEKIKEGVGYNVVPPPAADLYLSPKKYLSWTGLPEFIDDTVTDYSRPSPTVASTSSEDQNKDTSTSEEDHTSDWLRVVAIAGVFARDIYGDHAVSCDGVVGIKHRHNLERDTLIDICFRSVISAGKEVDIGLGGGLNKLLRSADMFLYSWDRDLDVYVDLKGSSPLTQTGMDDFMLGCAVIEAAQHNRAKCEVKCIDIGYCFPPSHSLLLGNWKRMQ
uniref:Uncharacterized protein n=1 Tax=Tanacetum cinerariifolium TaxID=118510 RepID=A0A6L2MAU9_TANCI|nr:hypothetical protein [Tanacetum cinerariifolium]